MAQQIMTAAQVGQVTRDLIAAIAPAGNQRRRATEKRLPSFSSGNASQWYTWRNGYLNIAELKQWDDEEKKLQLIAAMEGEANSMVSSINTVGRNWQQVLADYSNAFLPPAAGEEAREDFKRAKQRPEESLAHWSARLIELYSRAFPLGNNNTDVQLIERFIRGMNNAVVMDRTHDTRPTTMRDALQTASTKLAGIQMVKQAVMENRKTPGVYAVQDSGAEAPIQSESEIAALNTECFHCHRLGHFRNECPLRSTPQDEARRKARRGGGGGRGRGRGRGRSGEFRPRGDYGGRRGRGRGGRRPVNERTINALADAVAGALDMAHDEHYDDEEEAQGN